MKSLRCSLGLHDMGEWVRDGYVYRSKCSRCHHEKIKVVPSSVIKAEFEAKVITHIAEYLIDRAMPPKKQGFGKKIELDEWR